MIYGLYLSATGVLTNSHRQDVIANNLANSEAVGFKRSLALFQQRRTEAQQQGNLNATDPMLEHIGGGMLLSPSYVDQTQGALEQTHNNLDAAIVGPGFFAVKAGKDTRLTRNGQFMLDREGNLILADGSQHRVLDVDRNPIMLKDVPQSQISIAADGTITANDQIVGQIGVFDVPNPALLQQQGGSLLNYPNMKQLRPAAGSLQCGFTENANVDPTIELTQLITAQRQLEANASMIRMQDQTLGKLVSDVGRIT